MLEADRTALCGERYARAAERTASRAGHVQGELAMGGRRIAVTRPRVRGRDGREAVLPTWEHFRDQDPLTGRAVEQMLVGVSTRRYARSLEPAPAAVKTRGTSKSAVSRRFVAATSKNVSDVLGRDLAALNLTAIFIDGIHVSEHVVLVALGVDDQGNKHVLGLAEGATENAVVCASLLANLHERGLIQDRPLLFVIDGSKALAKAIRAAYGSRALIQRCQVHKRRNVLEHLPKPLHAQVGSQLSAAYQAKSVARARRLLEGTARWLERKHPGAAASLREGLEETLTVTKLGLPPALVRTLATTNAIENLNGAIRRTARNVKTWKDGSMVVRWTAVAVDDASKRFRKVRGVEGMPKLVAALKAHADAVAGRVDDVSKAA